MGSSFIDVHLSGLGNWFHPDERECVVRHFHETLHTVASVVIGVGETQAGWERKGWLLM